MKKIVAIMMLIAILTGCSGGKETTITGKGNANGMLFEVEIVSNGDKVVKEKAVLHMDLKSLGVSEEEAKKSAESNVAAMQEVEGISYKVDSTSEEIIITTEINYSKASIKELQKAGILGSDIKADYVGLKVTKDNYEKKYNVDWKE